MAGSALLAVTFVGFGSHQGPSPAAADQSTAGTAMPLQEFANDGVSGRVWNAYNQTDNAQGPPITGRPSPVVSGSSVQVFARAAGGDLTEYANDDANGRLWNAYDRTETSGGPAITGDPSSVILNPNETAAFAQSSSGDLTEFVDDGLAGHAWNAYNLTQLTGGPTVVGDPGALLAGGSVDVFARAVNGDLLEFSQPNVLGATWTETDLTEVDGGQMIAGDPQGVLVGTSSLHVYAVTGSGDLVEFVNDGANGRTWNSYDLTVGASGPQVSGRPSPIVYGQTVHVYVTSQGGDLTEYVNDGANHRLWNAYDLTHASVGPTIVGDPSAVSYGKTQVHVYAQSATGDLVEFVNDGAWGRTWNSYDQSQTVGGLKIGGDPGAGVYGASVHVYVAGPPPPPIVQHIVSLAEQADQYNAAVVENPPGSNCNPYTAYWGRGTTTGCAAGLSAEEWCSDFAQWVWAAAGVNTTGINGWSYSFVGWGESHTGAWKPGDTNDPEVGDAVIWGDVGSAYGAHVGIVVGVSDGMIDVVSGNSGPTIDAAGDVDAVWDSGYFDPTTSTVAGYPIIGYVSPTNWSSLAAHLQQTPTSGAQLSAQIASQDGGH